MTGCWLSTTCVIRSTSLQAADVSNESPRKAYDRAPTTLPVWKKKLSSGTAVRGVGQTSKRPSSKLRVHPLTSRKDYEQSVRTARNTSRRGIFSVVLSQRLDLAPGVAPFDISSRTADCESPPHICTFSRWATRTCSAHLRRCCPGYRTQGNTVQLPALVLAVAMKRKT